MSETELGEIENLTSALYKGFGSTSAMSGNIPTHYSTIGAISQSGFNWDGDIPTLISVVSGDIPTRILWVLSLKVVSVGTRISPPNLVM